VEQSKPALAILAPTYNCLFYAVERTRPGTLRWLKTAICLFSATRDLNSLALAISEERGEEPACKVVGRGCLSEADTR
jgi:hypothetical protein